MASKWEEVLNDKTNYSDDHIVKLADGTEVRLGEIRPSHMMEGDYRKKTALLARQREELEAQAAARIQAIQEGEAQLKAIAAELVARGMPRQEAREEAQLYVDPEVTRLKAELTEIKGAIKPIVETLQGMQQSAQAQRQQFVVNEHRKALSRLQAAHPDLNPEELVYYARDNMIPNLEKAYIAMNHEKIVESKSKEAREAAFKEGYEKAKIEASAAPILPMRTVVPQKVEGAPKNMREAMDKALRDPDVMGPLTTGRVGV